MEGLQALANEESSQESRPVGEPKEIKYSNPKVMRSLSNKEREGTPKRMPSPEEPSPTLTPCLIINE
jgi:hypothetical protein